VGARGACLGRCGPGAVPEGHRGPCPVPRRAALAHRGRAGGPSADATGRPTVPGAWPDRRDVPGPVRRGVRIRAAAAELGGGRGGAARVRLPGRCPVHLAPPGGPPCPDLVWDAGRRRSSAVPGRPVVLVREPPAVPVPPVPLVLPDLHLGPL